MIHATSWSGPRDQAFFTEEALTAIAQTTLHNVTAFEQGRPLANDVSVTEASR